MKSPNLRGAALLLALLVPGLALAGVGTISKLEGKAFRTPKEGQKAALKVGDAVELEDTLEVGPKSNLKLTLTDESVLMLGADSVLRIDEATFAGQDRKGFRAFLSVGKVWAKVKKALSGSDARFEVTTERAVAGVRGTIFRVDAIAAMKATAPAKAPKARRASRTVVRVEEGKVAVEAEVKKQAVAMAPQAPAQKGKRVQVSGPKQVTAEEWEKRFVELQRGMKVVVGESLWEEGRYAEAEINDDFGRFVQASRE